MDLLRQRLAPISDKGWEEINETAQEKFSGLLSARKFSDFDGPKGRNFPAVTDGRLNIKDENSEVKYGLYNVMPMIEARIPFKLNIWELDNLERGAEDIDLDNLEEAAEKMAAFEENIIYNGLEEANLKGIIKSAEHSVSYSGKTEDILSTTANGVSQLARLGTEGPYALVVNKDTWVEISGLIDGYPLRKQLEKILEGNIIISECIESPVLLTMRGGDFRITSGQDLSIGYQAHDTKEVELYLTESFTFQVIDPDAYLLFKTK
jgi:uncharacterized linocin/CFP29 family protein